VSTARQNERMRGGGRLSGCVHRLRPRHEVVKLRRLSGGTVSPRSDGGVGAHAGGHRSVAVRQPPLLPGRVLTLLTPPMRPFSRNERLECRWDGGHARGTPAIQAANHSEETGRGRCSQPVGEGQGSVCGTARE